MKKIIVLLASIYLTSTAQVPNMLKDITPGSASTNFYWFYGLPNNHLLFTAKTGTADLKLWVSDGSTAGTKPIRNYSAFNYTPFNNKIYFKGGAAPGALYRIDPITEVIDSIPASGLISINSFVVNNNLLYFTANASYTPSLQQTSYSLWRSDGTTSGTYSLTGALNSLTTHTVVNNILYFTANTPSTGVELWRSDGTQAGTFLLSDIWPGPTGSIANGSILGSYNNQLFFIANNGVTGNELWKTDGTIAGTNLVKDIYPGSGSSNLNPISFYSGNNGVYFAALHPTFGNEMWFSDGTLANTQLIIDVIPGTGGMFVSGPPVFSGNYSYYNYNNVLYKTNGTAAGTSTLDINSIYTAPVYSLSTRSVYSSLQIKNNEIYFLINKIQSPNVTDTLILCKTDLNLSAITPLIKASNNQALPILPSFTQMYQIANKFIFTGQGGKLISIFDNQLNRGKVFRLIGNPNSSFFGRFIMPQFGNKLYFPIASTPGFSPGYIDLNTDSLYTLNSLVNLSCGSSFYYNYLLNNSNVYRLNNKAYFLATEGAFGTEFFETDFTTGGTSRVKDIYPGSVSLDNNKWDYCADASMIVQTANNIFFIADDGVNGLELWSFTNTPNNPGGGVSVKDIKTEAGRVELYPNPTSGKLHVNSGEDKINSIIVLNALGAKVKEVILTENSSSAELDLSSVSAGVYFVQVNTTKGEVTKKLVKQ